MQAVRGVVLDYLALTLPATLAATFDIRFTGWANVNRRTHSNALHEHVDQASHPPPSRLSHVQISDARDPKIYDSTRTGLDA